MRSVERSSAEALMTIHTDFKFHPNITQVGCHWGTSHNELYLLEGERLAIVDSGVKGMPTEFLAPALERIGRKLSDVEIVLNTHGHMDHTGGNAEMAAAGAEIWMPDEDVR